MDIKNLYIFFSSYALAVAAFYTFACVHCTSNVDSPTYSVDTLNGVWTTFDGIGAISGGGATSKLLINYPEPHRSNILDYLFKPGFGASLQILKVEIGGDSQSSEGSEASHMHWANDESYYRGYEWWLMKEAKNRNPEIQLYGLPWTFPGWVGGGVRNPFINRTATVRYIVNWIQGAWQHHGLKINYIGVWNERTCDKEYVKLLRATMDKEGLGDIRIVAPDAQSWAILNDFKSDRDFLKAVDIIGQHYPATTTPDEAFQFAKTLWASEEYSTESSLAGGGCWARVLSESPVNGFYTGFIAWNLITSYYNEMGYAFNSLMTANEPWSGNYVVTSPIWITAHHTQFYERGWYYLRHGHGVDRLQGNGTFVSVTSPDWKKLTIVIETVDPHDAACSYPMPHFSVAKQQKAIFSLAGIFSELTQLFVWYSYLDFTGNRTVLFERQSPIQVVNGQFSLLLNRNEVYTLTTEAGGHKGEYGKPPISQRFPVPYKETFEGYEDGAEPFNLAQQSGSFEVEDTLSSVHGKVMIQVSSEPPVDTCIPVMTNPISLVGDYSWTNVSLQMDILLNKTSAGDRSYASAAFIASNVDSGSCQSSRANGIFFWVSANTGLARLSGTQGASSVIAETKLPMLRYGEWFTLSLYVMGSKVVAQFNGVTVMSVIVKQLPSQHGFVGFGPDSYGIVRFDNLYISRADNVAVKNA